MAIPDRPIFHDYVVLGAGPAGLQLGYFLGRAGRDYVILEAQDTPGTFFRTFPRHRRLLSINKVYTGYEDHEINLRFDWNSLLSDDSGILFKDVSRQYFPDADELREYLFRYAEMYGLNIRYGVQIVQVSKLDGYLLLDQSGQCYRAKHLVVATGLSQPYVPPIPGIELAEKYGEMSVDPSDFKNQRVLILGKGNSAFETANNLTETAARIHLVSPYSVNMAWQTHFPGHLRAINNDFLDTYQLKSQNAVLDAKVERIERVANEYVVTVAYSHAFGETEHLRYDRILLCTGFRFDASIFDESCRPELDVNGRFPRLTSSWESTSIENLFFAGVLMYSRDVKKAASGFIHGFRYNIRALHRIFESRYHGGSWPSRLVDATPDALAQTLLQRINRTSALWQQFGFLCDVFVLSEDGRSARHYEELPIAYVADSGLFRDGRYLMLMLEYGPYQSNPFSVTRNPSPEHSSEGTFLHPIVRRFDGVRSVAEHHVLENLLGEWWDEELHLQPLLVFLRQKDDAAVLESSLQPHVG
jgi:thioredoxin reductase